MQPEILDLYDRLLTMAVEAAPHEAEYCRDLHGVWRKAMEHQPDPETVEQASRIRAQARQLERNLKSGLSASALVEWLDAFPAAIVAVTDEQVV